MILKRRVCAAFITWLHEFFAGVAERYFMSFLFSRTIDRVHESIQTLRWEDKSPRSSLGASFFLPLSRAFPLCPRAEADQFLSHERDLSADLRWYVQVCACRLHHRSEVGHQDAVVRDYPYSSIFRKFWGARVLFAVEISVLLSNFLYRSLSLFSPLCFFSISRIFPYDVCDIILRHFPNISRKVFPRKFNQ